MDSSTSSLCLSMFEWARFRQTKGAVKLHTLLDHDGYLPVYVYISNGKKHDVTVARRSRERLCHGFHRGGSWPPFFTNKGEEDIFLARFGFGGTLFSVTLVGTTGDDEGKAIAINASNTYLYVAGFTNGNLDGIQNAGVNDTNDMCLLKFNTAGTEQ